MTTIQMHRKPMTFAQIRKIIIESRTGTTKLKPTFERSLRRAFQRLIADDLLIAIGDGGPGDPLRYFIHPLAIGIMGDTPETRALHETLLPSVATSSAIRGGDFTSAVLG